MISLEWEGKQQGRAQADERSSMDVDVIETFGAPEGPANRVVWGDNLALMQALLPSHAGTVDLIYVDPPFGIEADMPYATDLGRGALAPAGKRFVASATAYRDRWDQGPDGYLTMLYPRLLLMHRLLRETGSLYLHLDPTMSHPAKVLLDEVFGPECFQREIIWRIGWISGYKSAVKNWVRNHDVILFYVKTPGHFTFHKEYVPYGPDYVRRGGGGGKGYPIEDVWNANQAEFMLQGEESLDSIQIKSFSAEKTGFATQKNKSLLRRIVRASSNPGDLVADFFCGSGTTLVVAQEEGRCFLGCDSSPIAITAVRKRLVTGPQPAALQLLHLPPEPTVGSAWRARVLEAYGATPSLPPFSGRAPKTGLLVGEVDQALGADQITQAAEACHREGLPTLCVAAWTWAPNVTNIAQAWRARGIDVALLQLPHRAGPGELRGRPLALPELPEVSVRAEATASVVRVRIESVSYPHPEWLPAATRTAAWDGWIDYWAVSRAAEGPLRPVFATGRMRRSKQSLAVTATIPCEDVGAAVVVQVVDVFGQQVQYRVAVSPAETPKKVI